MYLNKNIFIKRGLSLTEMGTKIKDNLKRKPVNTPKILKKTPPIYSVVFL